MSGQRPGFNTVTPRVVVDDVPGLIRFLETVFGAENEAPREPAEMRIGDSLIMVSSAVDRSNFAAFLYVYVDDVADVERTHRAAVEAGATSVEEPLDTPYGDRRAMFEDPFGNRYQVASVIER